MKRKEIFISLIHADLINKRFAEGLEVMSFDGDSHYLKLSDLVFDLLGMDDCRQCEQAHQLYYRHSHYAYRIQLDDEAGFKKMASELYDTLTYAIRKIEHRASFDFKKNPLTMKKIIIELIKCDLINTKMINGLNRIDIEASKYRINVTPVIFVLLDIKQDDRTDKIYERYFNMLNKYETYDSLKGELDSAAIKIYASLNRMIKSQASHKIIDQ